MKKHLVVFMKAPSMGRVKRRLAIEIGDLPALTFYRRCLEGLFLNLSRGLSRSRDFRLWLAITPDRSAKVGTWRLTGASSLPRRPKFLPQGPGNLGDRMARVFQRLPAGAAVIVGSDIPTLTSTQIEAAFGRLRNHDVVFGPATDGGYYLVGIADRALARTLFTNVRWSTSHALADTLANLTQRQRVAFLDPLDDVDNEQDFKRVNLGIDQLSA